MDLRSRIEEALERLKPKLEYLAEGYAELMTLDEQTCSVTLRLFGGKLM